MSEFTKKIVWSREVYTLQDLHSRRFPYPLVAKAEYGIYGDTDAYTISTGQAILLHGWEQCVRIIAKTKDNIDLAIPIEDEHRFEVYQTRGTPKKLGLFSLKTIIKKFNPPVLVRFDPLRSVEFYAKGHLYDSKTIGLLDLISTNYLSYVKTSLINDDGGINSEMLRILPIHLDTGFFIGKGMSGCSHTEFSSHLRKLAHCLKIPKRGTIVTCSEENQKRSSKAKKSSATEKRDSQPVLAASAPDSGRPVLAAASEYDEEPGGSQPQAEQPPTEAELDPTPSSEKNYDDIRDDEEDVNAVYETAFPTVTSNVNPPAQTAAYSSRHSTKIIHSYNQIPEDIISLGISEIADCLILLRLDKYVDRFTDEQIDGMLLKECSTECLIEEFGMGKLQANKVKLFAQGTWRPKP